jgi:hypothetical protein
MQKKPRRGRPKKPAGQETEQVSVRLPTMMLKFLRPHVAKEIRERLAGSLFDDTRDPNIAKLQAQIERLAKEVSLATGREWHKDSYSHAIFVEAVRLLLADLTAPSEAAAQFKIEPTQAAAMIYMRYVNDARQLEKFRKIGVRAPLSFQEFSPEPTLDTIKDGPND